ncbi:hypothetical protein PSEMO_22390 [Pseudomonas putida]|uniref:Protein kinase domain-containing protein n=1 Tax=Pseudomonas putida TaxID=303 RepID=A0A1Q9R6A4_PSEPU|nr:hypothetical protein PSEMO_22390 [Pseudomonas putida]
MQRLARSIAEVAAHLHGQGLSHGDLYGHNILCDERGHSLLGDFGAASFHPRDGGVEARLLERIEVRAFGVLLGELLERCGEELVGMRGLQQACVRAEVLERPRFGEILNLL